MGEAIKVKEQDRTCYGTCTCRPWDRSRPPQVKNTQSLPSPAGMANMNHKRASSLEGWSRQPVQSPSSALLPHHPGTRLVS